MVNKIRLLLVSVNFLGNSGLGIIEHGIRIYSSIKKYSNIVEVYKYSLVSDRLFNSINKKARDLLIKKPGDKNKKTEKPNIIHYTSPGVFMSSIFIKPLFNYKAKQVVTIHDLDMIKKIPKIGINNYTNKELTKGPMKMVNMFLNSMEKNGLKLAVKKADHILCVSEITKNDLIKTFNLPSKKISVVYNIIGKEFKHLTHKKNKKVVIGHLSSYAYNKNAETLVEAFRKVKSDKFELHLYGAKLPFDISKDKRIKYFGHAKDIVKMYNSFDVFVFPSKWEGFGMPVMEAKKCQIPVITYKYGELPGIVKNNTIQFKDVNDLKEILERQKWKVIDTKKAYRDTKKCEEKYVVRELEKMYKNIMEDKC